MISELAIGTFTGPEGTHNWAKYIELYNNADTTVYLDGLLVVVLATDAIDHSEFVQGAPDLSNADFEFLGRSDVDNPSVPNLLPVGPGIDQGLRGLIHHSHEAVPFVARPVDVATLPSRTIVIQNELEYVRIPKEALIDVGHFIWFGGLPVCNRVVHPEIDQAARPITRSEAVSLHRRTLVEAADGQAILQDTNTSERDFGDAPRSPGEVSR